VKRAALVLGAAWFTAGTLTAQEPGRSMGGGQCAASVYNCADTPNPLPPTTSVWIEAMTWMDVRDALDAGKRTAIIPTGGVEPNGPWLATGKHNYVLQANCEAIARRLGDALCAPVLPFVPEGSIEPRSGHMTSPGTISMREATYRAILTDMARSLKAHGFNTILFIGDSGGNQGGQFAVAEELNAEWPDVVVGHVQEYYDYRAVSRFMAETHGYRGTASDGLHDDPIISLNMFYDSPFSIRFDERVAAGLATINGVDLSDRVRSLELARAIVDYRARRTVAAIGLLVADGGTRPAPPPSPQQAAAGGGGGGGRSGGAAPDPRNMGGGQCAASVYNCADTPNPLPPVNTVWIEEMTWMDVRDALNAGKRTAIIATGGVEPNGPWLVTGKHNYVLRTNCEAIARKLGDALCAPIVKLVPEGRIDPPSGHMTSPGTISMTQATYEAMLTDIAHSLKMHGFRNIVFIGDSGGNQSGQQAVAERLNAEWRNDAVVAHIQEYYSGPPGTPNVLRGLGVVVDGMPSDGLHDSPDITLNMMLTDLSSVRWAERVHAGQATIDGVSLADLPTALGWAQEIVEARANRTVEVIRQRLADGGTPPASGGER